MADEGDAPIQVPVNAAGGSVKDTEQDDDFSVDREDETCVHVDEVADVIKNNSSGDVIRVQVDEPGEVAKDDADPRTKERTLMAKQDWFDHNELALWEPT
jgi:hypothetical protein